MNTETLYDENRFEDVYWYLSKIVSHGGCFVLQLMLDERIGR